MRRYRILVAYNDGNMYEDYVDVDGSNNGFGRHGMALINKMESIIGGGSGDTEFPSMYILEDSADVVEDTELAFYKLLIADDDYAYLFFKKQGVMTGESINVFPMLRSLEDGDVEKIIEYVNKR